MYNEIHHLKSNANKYSKLDHFLIILVHFTIIKVLGAISFCLLGLYSGNYKMACYSTSLPQTGINHHMDTMKPARVGIFTS